MNPLTNIKNVQKLNDRELELGIIGKKSWHDEYKDSAWVFIGGLPYDLSEGDIVCVFSQYGEIVNFNLVRDHSTGKSKGFAFLCYEDQRSTVLSVDNLNGIKILGRTIRVDHVKDYKVPKEHKDDDELTKKIRAEGVAPKLEESSEEEGRKKSDEGNNEKKEKSSKTDSKKKLKREKKKKLASSSHSDTGGSDNEHTSDNKIAKSEIKKEKWDSGYDRALNPASDADSRRDGKHRTHAQGRDWSSKNREDRSDRSHRDVAEHRAMKREDYSSGGSSPDVKGALKRSKDYGGSRRDRDSRGKRERERSLSKDRHRDRNSSMDKMYRKIDSDRSRHGWEREGSDDRSRERHHKHKAKEGLKERDRSRSHERDKFR